MIQSKGGPAVRDFQRVVFRRVGIAVAVASMTVAAIAVVAASVAAARGTHAAAACLAPAVTPPGAKVRLALRGKVSCAQARRTVRAFLRDENSGACGSGRICEIRQPGGWQCALLSTVESRMLDGEQADCVRAGGSFGVYKASRKATETSRRTAQDAPRANVAAEHFRACGNFKALHVGIDVHRVSCAKSRRIVRAYLHGKGVGGDFARVKGFAAWMCSTGDRSGGCWKGGFARGVPQINFFYLVPPG